MREMISLQLAMCLMILAGVVLKKTGIFGKTGQKNMTDLVIDLFVLTLAFWEMRLQRECMEVRDWHLHPYI